MKQPATSSAILKWQQIHLGRYLSLPVIIQGTRLNLCRLFDQPAANLLLWGRKGETHLFFLTSIRLGRTLRKVRDRGEVANSPAWVQKAWGKKPLRVAQVKALKDEHVRRVTPLQALAAEARQLEVRVAELVNAVSGLTPQAIALLWRTAPPRMPGSPPGS